MEGVGGWELVAARVNKFCFLTGGACLGGVGRGAVRDVHLLSSLLLARECLFSLPLISLFIVHLVGLINLGFSCLASGIQAAGVTTPWGGKSFQELQVLSSRLS